jgi:hypothetical protein
MIGLLTSERNLDRRTLAAKIHKFLPGRPREGKKKPYLFDIRALATKTHQGGTAHAQNSMPEKLAISP